MRVLKVNLQTPSFSAINAPTASNQIVDKKTDLKMDGKKLALASTV